ncbi:cobalamin biosynthesis protein [Nocardia thailandica]|uniref:Cobalamin biosynthesis protein n=1 Tax=Nocardia thailandica TaxID=257275 RepID=A0ABW6PPW6_9NOCA
MSEDAGRRLAVGIGLRENATAAQVVAAVRAVSVGARVHRLATLDRRLSAPGLREAAALLCVEAIGYPAERLAEVAVPHPSERTAAAVGTAAVAEAAALLAGGGPLVCPKRVVGGVVVAAALVRD